MGGLVESVEAVTEIWGWSWSLLSEAAGWPTCKSTQGWAGCQLSVHDYMAPDAPLRAGQVSADSGMPLLELARPQAGAAMMSIMMSLYALPGSNC